MSASLLLDQQAVSSSGPASTPSASSNASSRSVGTTPSTTEEAEAGPSSSSAAAAQRRPSPTSARPAPARTESINVHANSTMTTLPRPPPPAHFEEFAEQHSLDNSSTAGGAQQHHSRQHSVGRARGGLMMASRPSSPASGLGHEQHAHALSVSDRSGLRHDGVLREPESVVVHEDDVLPVASSSSTIPTRPAASSMANGSAPSIPLWNSSPLRGGVGLGMSAGPHLLPSQHGACDARFFSSALAHAPVPHLSPSDELNDALVQAQDDHISTDELKPHAEVEPGEKATPSFWEALFLPSQRSNSGTDASLDRTNGRTARRPLTTHTMDPDGAPRSRPPSESASSNSLLSSIPNWLSSPLSRSPTASPRPESPSNNNNVAPSEANSTFLESVTRLRSLLGLAENEAPEDWVRSHRAEIDDVVRAAERAEALEMAKRRAEGLAKGRRGTFFTMDAEGGLAPSVGVGQEDGQSDARGKASEGEPEEQILRMQEEWTSPKLPVVFCHGLFGFDVLGPRSVPALTINYWRGIINILQSNGTEVLVTRVPMSASIADRAAALQAQIEEHFDEGQEINLIGHSMGGLDSRYLISRLGMGKEGGAKVRVRSLTTIATPHRGSSFADYMLDQIIGKERMPFLLNALEKLGIPGGGAAFENLTVRSMAKFNEEVPDCEGVHYFSWGAAFQPGLFNEFRIPHGIIYAKEGANDGLVSVQSSMHGQYQGTLRGVSHLHLIGWVSAAQNAWRDLVGKRRVFEPAAFYLQICEDLAKAGF